MEIRLQKFLADAGIASRRKSEELILAGNVKVNGVVCKELGTKINPETDEVLFQDKAISSNTKLVYLMLHKPEGYVTTVKDQFARPAVLDLVKGVGERIFPVGRLDYDTSGLLILTNDGDLTYRLTHPSNEVPKTYEAKLFGIPDDNDCIKFRHGVFIDGIQAKPAQLSIIEKGEKYSTVRIVITEGKNRQVRKMCDSIKHPVAQLKRVATGDLSLGTLKRGEYRHLTDKEVAYLKSL